MHAPRGAPGDDAVPRPHAAAEPLGDPVLLQRAGRCWASSMAAAVAAVDAGLLRYRWPRRVRPPPRPLRCIRPAGTRTAIGSTAPSPRPRTPRGTRIGERGIALERRRGPMKRSPQSSSVGRSRAGAGRFRCGGCIPATRRGAVADPARRGRRALAAAEASRKAVRSTRPRARRDGGSRAARRIRARPECDLKRAHVDFAGSAGTSGVTAESRGAARTIGPGARAQDLSKRCGPAASPDACAGAATTARRSAGRPDPLRQPRRARSNCCSPGSRC